jgi:MATE family multidrug resistance protein
MGRPEISRVRQTRSWLPLAWQQRWAEPSGGRELARLALPLILSNSVWTFQITLDRILLSRQGEHAVGAAMAGVLLFWTPMTLLQNTANYATTFVAQYIGAGRPQRVGPIIWQSCYFSLIGGALFLGLWPLADWLVALGGHSEALQAQEAIYFRCLCFAGFPTLLTAAASSFFAGLGRSWTVLAINLAGLAVNGVLSYGWIFGAWGFPAWGIAGAGWATVWGTSTSAVLAVALMLRSADRAEFQTLSGWRFDAGLFGRLMRFGLPSGIQGALDTLAFTVFLFLVGRLGDVELDASSIAFTLNLVAFLPALGLGQAVAILVGQRLGQDRPDLAERSTWSGLALAWAFMTAMAVLYVLAPRSLLALFHGQDDSPLNEQVGELVPILLRFVAVYSIFDSMNVVFAFALRGAGDTHFVSVASMVLAWPLMVVPTWLAWQYQWGLHAAWSFATSYIIALALTYCWRFCRGPWRSMRVIETVQPEIG